MATILTITRANAVHALLYLIISLLAVAVIFFMLGAPFIAALEAIIYAGAVMVLFVFVVIMFNLSADATALERQWLTPRTWIGPTVLAAILLAEVIILLSGADPGRITDAAVDPHQVARALYQPYLLGVELASFLLLTGLVGAYHLAARRPAPPSGEAP